MPYSTMLTAAELSSLADLRDQLSCNIFLGITEPSSYLPHLSSRGPTTALTPKNT